MKTYERKETESVMDSIRTIVPTVVLEQMFGDTIITLMRDPNGGLFVKVRRGMPSEKTYSIEHYFLLVAKFQNVCEEIQKRIGGNE